MNDFSHPFLGFIAGFHPVLYDDFRMMRWFNARFWLLPVALCVLVLVGCGLGEGRPVDDEMEANFIEGRTALKLKDYDRAIAHFESALEANPRSAAAHRELGILYSNQRTNYIRSLFHFDRFRQLRPDDKAPEIDGQERQATLFLIQQKAGEIERTVQQNEAYRWRQLCEQKDHQIDQLKREVQRLASAAPMPVPEVPNHSASHPTGSDPTPPSVPPVTTRSTPVPHSQTPSTPSTTQDPPRATTRSPVSTQPIRPSGIVRPAPPSRTIHTVVAGDNLSRIAKRYGLTVSQLRTANPSINANALKIGSSLVIPKSSSP